MRDLSFVLQKHSWAAAPKPPTMILVDREPDVFPYKNASSDPAKRAQASELPPLSTKTQGICNRVVAAFITKDTHH
jgi:hypothetical protein